MESKSYHLEILAWVAVVIATISMFATPALSEEAFTACLQNDGTQCTLIAPLVGMLVTVADGDAVISYFVPSEEGWKVSRTESVNKDMEQQVLSGAMTDTDAAYVFAELLSSHDLQYQLPIDAIALKKDVGLDPAAPLSPQDQVDVIGSHLQMTLGVSALTADYLIEKLGLEIVTPNRN